MSQHGLPADPPVTITPGVEGTILAVIGYSVLFVLSVRVGMLSWQVRRTAGRPRALLWQYFILAGFFGGLAGGVEITARLTGVAGSLARPLLLGVTVALAVAMQEAFKQAQPEAATVSEQRWIVETAAVSGLVVVAIAIELWTTTVADVILAGVAISAAGYGVYFQRQRIQTPATRGTMLDTLLRQALPAVVFAAGAVILPVFEGRLLGPALTDLTTTVFVLLVGAALLPVTVKLRQQLGPAP